jgi:hypothetical protein
MEQIAALDEKQLSLCMESSASFGCYSAPPIRQIGRPGQGAGSGPAQPKVPSVEQFHWPGGESRSSMLKLP